MLPIKGLQEGVTRKKMIPGLLTPLPDRIHGPPLELVPRPPHLTPSMDHSIKKIQIVKSNSSWLCGYS